MRLRNVWFEFATFFGAALMFWCFIDRVVRYARGEFQGLGNTEVFGLIAIFLVIAVLLFRTSLKLGALFSEDRERRK